MLPDEHSATNIPDPTVVKSDKPIENLRQVREDSLNGLAKVITTLWGSRCDRAEAGCYTCFVWSIFDLVEKITDGSLLDLPENFHDKH